MPGILLPCQKFFNATITWKGCMMFKMLAIVFSQNHSSMKYAKIHPSKISAYMVSGFAS